eukprot:TRINITY_DN23940_c0_g1_i5.p1 TRINITY_DN23940_c0_g1~~TRINITY_DN23940_c0_g1_i5.p1  ORF type:complete len:299 (+),score=16.24 TRINITY_DN23940_c0_g1_i5:173-1069(+)
MCIRDRSRKLLRCVAAWWCLGLVPVLFGWGLPKQVADCPEIMAGFAMLMVLIKPTGPSLRYGMWGLISSACLTIAVHIYTHGELREADQRECTRFYLGDVLDTVIRQWHEQGMTPPQIATAREYAEVGLRAGCRIAHSLGFSVLPDILLAAWLRSLYTQRTQDEVRQKSQQTPTQEHQPAPTTACPPTSWSTSRPVSTRLSSEPQATNHHTSDTLHHTAAVCEDPPVKLQVLLPSGERMTCTFASSDTPHDIINFACPASNDPRCFRLCSMYPRQQLHKSTPLNKLNVAGTVVMLEYV